MKDLFLLILVIILLCIIFFLNTKSLESFDNIDAGSAILQEEIPSQIVEKSQEPPEPKTYPLLNEADDVPQMYRLQKLYPYGGVSDYEVSRFPNVVLSGNVVGCGSRREPCYGGSQQVIGNILPPLDVSNENIAPRNGFIGPNPPFEEVGYLYKIFGQYEQNTYLPLYMKRIKETTRYPKYEYFTKIDGKNRKVIIPSEYRQLGTNDQVKIAGTKYYWRVTINESNFPGQPNISRINN
jgi:hypothetical protein